jgi:hypothetical protein
MKLKKSVEAMSKPLVVGTTLFGSIAFALVLTFADPNVVRSRLGLSSPADAAGQKTRDNGAMSAKALADADDLLSTNAAPQDLALTGVK